MWGVNAWFVLQWRVLEEVVMEAEKDDIGGSI